MTTSTTPQQRSPSKIVDDVVGRHITRLQRAYLKDYASWAVAALAQLRRGAGKLPEDVPELWGVTGTERLYQHGDLGESELLRAERALFLAVTLYALHQQSRPAHGMHRAGIELGAAVRRLMPVGEIDEPIRRRFVRVGTAPDLEALAYRLREIVSLLRRDSIPLDYALLTRRLYQAQTPEGMRRVRQSWGRSFHSFRPREDQPAAGDADTTTPAKEDI